jgi:exodeoxyribonuclease VII large subunit
MRHLLELGRAALGGLLQRNALAEPLSAVHRRELVVDELCSRMQRAMLSRVNRTQAALRRCEDLLQRIRPQAYLLRLERELSHRQRRLDGAMSRRLTSGERRLAAAVSAMSSAQPALRAKRCGDGLEHGRRRLGEVMRRRLTALGDRLTGEAARLSALSHRSTLKRGFTITRTKRGRRVVRSARDVDDGTHLLTETADGEFESEVRNLKQLELFE